jgi:glutaredoxin/glutathione-dependent peroxiredoxin
MTISTGDRLPTVNFRHMTADGPADIASDVVFGGRTVALFSVPGAFTSTCSAKHLPSFIANADALKAKGIDEIVCTAVNDIAVMSAWSKAAGADGKVTMLADGNGDFVRAIGLEADFRPHGMGMRGQRFSMVVKDGVVTQLNIEAPREYNVSSGDHMLGQL